MTCAGVPIPRRAAASLWEVVVLPLAEGPVSMMILAPDWRIFWAA